MKSFWNFLWRMMRDKIRNKSVIWSFKNKNMTNLTYYMSLLTQKMLWKHLMVEKKFSRESLKYGNKIKFFFHYYKKFPCNISRNFKCEKSFDIKIQNTRVFLFFGFFLVVCMSYLYFNKIYWSSHTIIIFL